MQDTLTTMFKPLVLSYILDWILIIGVALIGYGFLLVTPHHTPFSLTDPSISLPYVEHPTVSVGVAAVVSVVAPAVIIALVAILFIPGSTVAKGTPRAVLWRYKLWEWNAGWMGLGVAAAGAFMASQGLKDLYGKPRPDMLARCDPDLSDVGAYAVGGLGQKLAHAPTIVTWEICRNKSSELKVNGFTSFPSGHSSVAFAGLTYLTLWLCSKFSVGFPYLSHFPFAPGSHDQGNGISSGSSSRGDKPLYVRNQGAAPPVYRLIIAFVPLAVASFIATSRWMDHRHHGFDIIFGSVMGVAFAWVGFQLYNIPIRRGAGWSWGPRSRQYAFFKGVGFPSHVGHNNWARLRKTHLTGIEARRPGMDTESASAALV